MTSLHFALIEGTTVWRELKTPNRSLKLRKACLLLVWWWTRGHAGKMYAKPTILQRVSGIVAGAALGNDAPCHDQLVWLAGLSESLGLWLGQTCEILAQWLPHWDFYGSKQEPSPRPYCSTNGTPCQVLLDLTAVSPSNSSCCAVHFIQGWGTDWPIFSCSPYCITNHGEKSR